MSQLHVGLALLAACAQGFDPSHPAAHLSEAGVFQRLEDLAPCAGFRPYEIRVPFWSDSAAKTRWMKLPEGARIGFHVDEPWEFPVGTAFIKHFELKTREKPKQRVETRVLVHVSTDEWRGFSYRWNAAGTDADLVGEEGGVKSFNVPDPAVPGGIRHQLWRFPSRDECLNCHRSSAGSALGPRTEQVLPALLDQWNQEHLFDQEIGPIGQLPAYPDPHDPQQKLERRAKAYLAANCAFCHHPGSPVPTPIDLRFSTPLEQMGIINAFPFAGNLGVKNPKIVKPGNRHESVLWLRISRRGEDQMPPIGSNRIDDDGVALIGRWIDQLPAAAAGATSAE